MLVEAAHLAPRWNPALKDVKERESKRGNKNRATLAVARKLVAYLLAVDKSRGSPRKERQRHWNRIERKEARKTTNAALIAR